MMEPYLRLVRSFSTSAERVTASRHRPLYFDFATQSRQKVEVAVNDWDMISSSTAAVGPPQMPHSRRNEVSCPAFNTNVISTSVPFVCKGTPPTRRSGGTHPSSLEIGRASCRERV